MDRPERQAWHTGIPFRSRKAGFEENDRVLLCHFEVESKGTIALANVAIIRTVREPDALCHAAVLFGTWPTQS